MRTTIRFLVQVDDTPHNENQSKNFVAAMKSASGMMEGKVLVKCEHVFLSEFHIRPDETATDFEI